MDTVKIALAGGESLNLPAGVSSLIDERSPLLLKISAQGVSGFIICARAEAAYTGWSPTVTHPESGEDEVIWSLRKD
jgi:hypothetical protein